MFGVIESTGMADVLHVRATRGPQAPVQALILIFLLECQYLPFSYHYEES